MPFMSSPRAKKQFNKRNSTGYVPDSTEIRIVIEQYIDEKRNCEGSLILPVASSPKVVNSVDDIKEYMMEKNPSWSIPEKRRLQKFVKRAMTKNHHRSAPTTPSSQQSENTADSTNSNELDSRSERSRSSRLKGITNRLFGNNSNKRNSAKKQKMATSPPVFEIQTTIKEPMTSTTTTAQDLSTVESVRTIHMSLQPVKIMNTNGDNIIKTIVKPSVMEKTNQDKTTSIGATATLPSDVDDELYRDDNDGAIAKGDRCCFLWFC